MHLLSQSLGLRAALSQTLFSVEILLMNLRQPKVHILVEVL